MADEEKSKAEEPEVKPEQDGKIPDQEPGKKPPEKTLPQSEVNKLMADERRKHKAELDKVTAEFNAYKQTIEEREQAANDAAAEQVEALRKDLPEPVSKLLDKLTPLEQLEWLRDPANTITKQTIRELPDGVTPPGRGPRITTII